MFQDSSVTTNSHQEFTTQNEEIILTMYHSESCMCCVRRAEYLEENGVTVIEKLVPDLHKIKREKAFPASLVPAILPLWMDMVEGHVPVEDIRRLLSEQPVESLGRDAALAAVHQSGSVLRFQHKTRIPVRNC
jgi:hypothetical protein